MRDTLSRRDMLKRAAIAGAAAAVPLRTQAGPAEAAPIQEPLETLTASEAAILGAIVARLIPTDENGPGATEAHAARYIDRALRGALASSREAYAAGLAAVDAYARSSGGRPFAELVPDAQDDVLRDMENDVASGFTPSSASFFNLVRSHTIHGMFCDPAYGGNADFVGWELIGYPGVRTAVTADQQRMDVALTARQISAFDFPAFAPSRERRTRGR